MNVDAAIRARFNELIGAVESLLEIVQAHDQAEEQQAAAEIDPYGFIDGPTRRRAPPPEPPEYRARDVTYMTLRTQATNLLRLLSTSPDDHAAKAADAFGPAPNEYNLSRMLGTLRGFLSDYEHGLLRKLTEHVEAEIAANYLAQAETLLDDTKRQGVADRVPAAVLAGAVLEAALRTLCERQHPKIDLVKPNGKKKMLNDLIDDLKTAGVYHETKAKELRNYAGIRNDAAHGTFDTFTKDDVKRMVDGVNAFLARYM